MDWSAIQQYLPLYQKAALLTVKLGVAGIFFAILIGLGCAMIQYEKIPVLRQVVAVYIQLSRNTSASGSCPDCMRFRSGSVQCSPDRCGRLLPYSSRPETPDPRCRRSPHWSECPPSAGRSR